MYDATLTLTRIRGLVATIKYRVDNSNNNVLYFTTGEYANDSFKLVELIKELDEFLTNNSIELAPIWWIWSPEENFDIQNGTVNMV